MGRIAVLGDLGGHLEELWAALIGLGADPDSFELPDDLSVVQVGDLINRGPDTPGCVELVDSIMERHPKRWIQLVGNHESLHLAGTPRFEWPEIHPEATVKTIQGWWESGAMQVAAALSSSEGSFLITHAGLTAGFHQKMGAPRSAEVAANELNRLGRLGNSPVWNVGGMITGALNLSAGPVWAEASGELYLSWLLAEEWNQTAPFGQIHGHSSAYWWARKRMSAPPEVAARLEIDPERRHVRARIAQAEFIGIDPGFGVRAGCRWAPLVLEGELSSGDTAQA